MAIFVEIDNIYINPDRVRCIKAVNQTNCIAYFSDADMVQLNRGAAEVAALLSNDVGKWEV
jgi:hypothetical protein